MFQYASFTGGAGASVGPSQALHLGLFDQPARLEVERADPGRDFSSLHTPVAQRSEGNIPARALVLIRSEIGSTVPIPARFFVPARQRVRARGGGLLPAAQAARSATQQGRKSARERPGRYTGYSSLKTRPEMSLG
jgi:hypothetical protein